MDGWIPPHHLGRGLRIGLTRVQAPNANAYAERFVRSIRAECLDRLILIGDRRLLRALDEFGAHHRGKRHPQGLGNELITPATTAGGTPVHCRELSLRPAGKWLICRSWSGENPSLMITLLHLLRLLPFLRGGPRQLALENLALRQQLTVYKRTVTRPRLRRTDRHFWVGLPGSGAAGGGRL
jgi:hypothetical protein